jgi:hypothetical protein
MPNWCENTIRFYFGKEERANEFIHFVKSDELDFDLNKILKYGELCGSALCNKSEFLGRLDGGFESPQDNFEVNNHGWHAYGYLIEVIFRTGWFPPVEVFKIIRKEFKDCDIRWRYDIEGGLGYGYLEHALEFNEFVRSMYKVQRDMLEMLIREGTNKKDEEVKEKDVINFLKKMNEDELNKIMQSLEFLCLSMGWSINNLGEHLNKSTKQRGKEKLILKIMGRILGRNIYSEYKQLQQTIRK